MRAAALCVLFLVSTVTCRRRDGKRKSDNEQTNTLANVCTSENRDSPFACTCDQKDLLAAGDVSCWVIPVSQNLFELPWDQFESQSNIKELKLSCRAVSLLNEFPTKLFMFMRKLRVFEIQYGKIREIFAYAARNASHLREMILTRNSISVLHPNAFSHMPELQIINLDDNSVYELQPMVFSHLPNLTKLFMARNNLSILHDNAFRFLNHLHELELNGNSISILTRETFNGLFRLHRLDLTNNKLTMLGGHTFAEMPKLRELELEGNSLEFLADNAFAGLHDLQRLRLADNKLSTLSDRLFVDTPNIQFLDLRDNSMHQLKFSTLEPLWESFKNLSTHLLLDGNEFACDCHLSWVYSLRNDTPNKEVIASLEELTCLLPEEMATNDEPIISSEVIEDDQQADENVVEYKDDEVEYEELPLEDGPPKKRVVDIAPGELPCPESQKAETEPPVYENNQLPQHAAGGAISLRACIHAIVLALLAQVIRLKCVS